MQEKFELWDVKQLVENLNKSISKSTIYDLVKKNQIPCVKIGKKICFRDYEVWEWLRAQ